MLILSDKWLTTHASASFFRAIATGSMPTGTEPISLSIDWLRSKISTRLSGVFTTNNLRPSVDIASGLTCPDSKAANDAVLSGSPLLPGVLDGFAEQCMQRKTDAKNRH